MTLDQLKVLERGDVLHENGCRITIGPRGGHTESIVCWRVSGCVRTWKRDVNRVEVPVKYGMYEHAVLDAHNCGKVHLESECVPRVVDRRMSGG